MATEAINSIAGIAPAPHSAPVSGIPQNADMTKRTPASAWAKGLERSFLALARNKTRANRRVTAPLLKFGTEKRKPPRGDGDWITCIALGAAGARCFRLYRPPAVQFGQRLPLVVMLHGCGQDARSFAESTRMNRIASDDKVGRKTVAALVELDQLAHAGSGGAAAHAYSDGAGPDASRMMWAFAATQFAV